MKKGTLILLSLPLLLFFGCGKASNQPAPEQQTQPQSAPAAQPAESQQPVAAQQPAVPAQQPAATQQAARTQPQAPAAEKSAERPAASQALAPSQPAASVPPAPPTPPPPKILLVDAGTDLEIRLSQLLDSGKNKAGDKFEATLDKDLVVEGKTVAPRGSVVTGKLVDVVGSGRVEGLARMSLTLTGIKIGEEGHSIATNTLSFEAQSTKGKDAKKIGIAAGIGTAIGAIAGGGKGAAIGAAVGGGAGTATVLATKGKEVTFDPEQKFIFKLSQELKVILKQP